MNKASCDHHIPLPDLIDYWWDQQDAAAQEVVEEHLLGCEECSARLAELVALAGGVRAAFGQGLLRAFVTPAFIGQLVRQGLRVHEYRIPCNGSVNCSVEPGDEVLISRLQAPLAGVSRIDAYSYLPGVPAAIARDIPFDPASGEVIVTADMARLREAPSHQRRIRLVAVDKGGERVIGDYTFNHGAGGPGPV